MNQFESWEEELLEALKLSSNPDDIEENTLPQETPETEHDPDWYLQAKLPPAESDRKQPRKRGSDPRALEKNVLQYVHDLAYLLAVVIVAFLLLFRVVVVSGTSMNMTLLDGDYLLVLSNTLYTDPHYGDIIVASKDSFDDGAPIVKRVIATEGQWVDIDFAAGIVYVGNSLDNMQALDEPYTNTLTTLREGVSFPLFVEDDCIFVMGDNRDGSKDSRSPEIGLIDKREILGKVILLFFPGTNGTDASRDFSRIGGVH